MRFYQLYLRIGGGGASDQDVAVVIGRKEGCETRESGACGVCLKFTQLNVQYEVHSVRNASTFV